MALLSERQTWRRGGSDIAQSELPNFLIVGLPDTAVQEARERVRAAIRNSGLSFPNRRRYRCCG